MRNLSRVSFVSAAVITSSCLGVSGIVSADSITDTGPGSTNYINSSYGNNNQGSGWSSSYSWGDMNPTTWQSNGQSFDNWWSEMMHQMSNCYWSGGSSNWVPSGSNWQSSWTNWSPTTWQSNGQNWGAWYGQMMSYMNGNYNNWMQGWNRNSSDTTTTTTTNNNNVDVSSNNSQSASTGNATVSDNTFGGSASTGDANNSNNTQVTADVTNASTPMPSNTGNDNSGYQTSNPDPQESNSSISDTGPGSRNYISSRYTNNYTQDNNNNVDVSNSNNQSAHTGNATVSDNTFGGNAYSGSAMNNSSSNTEVDINNQ